MQTSITNSVKCPQLSVKSVTDTCSNQRVSALIDSSRSQPSKRKLKVNAEASLNRRQAILQNICIGTAAASAFELRSPLLSKAEDITSYDQYAEKYDDLDGGTAAQLLGFDDLRQILIGKASGDVLEVGVGTGLNLPLYQRQKLLSLSAVDASQGMLDQAAAKAQTLSIQPILSFQQASVEDLPFDTNSFDTVVDTFSLCVFTKPIQALKEMCRVVRPDGRVLLLEHNRSPNPLLASYQDLTAGPVAAMSKGCVYNQDVRALVEAAGLRISKITPALGGLIQVVEAQKK